MTIDASDFNVPFEALFDRTAALVPTTTILVANGDWTKPANAIHCEIVIAGPGGDGGDGDTAGGCGGGGGSNGEVVRWSGLASALPTTLTAAFSGADVVLSGTGFFLFAESGAVGGDGDDGGAGVVGGDGGYGYSAGFAPDPVTIGGKGGSSGNGGNAQSISSLWLHGGGGGGDVGFNGGCGGGCG